MPRTSYTPLHNLLAVNDLSISQIRSLLKLAASYLSFNPHSDPRRNLLNRRSVILLFAEPSTRTQNSFLVAAKNLGAHTLTIQPSSSSMTKGETITDTAITLNAMKPDILVVRHPHSGAAKLLADKVRLPVINAGDGAHEHPTQALLDALVIQQRLGSFKNLQIAVCGDVEHSRVARSNIRLLSSLGAHVRVHAPPTLLPHDLKSLGAHYAHSMPDALHNADVVMLLRLQHERMNTNLIPSAREHFHLMGLTKKRLQKWGAKPNAFVMHPGPFNRGVELDASIADDPNASAIRQQVEMGVAARMAVLHALSLNLPATRT